MIFADAAQDGRKYPIAHMNGQFMKLLIADDEPAVHHLLHKLAESFGFEPVIVENGIAATEMLFDDHAPRIALLDWMMPGRSGVEICQLVRQSEWIVQPYLIVLTCRNSAEDIALALDSGANDYVKKPFSPVELRARLNVGRRMIEAMEHIRTLKGLLPICCVCKKIRDDDNYWREVEDYISQHSDAEFTHSICPECVKNRYPEIAQRMQERKARRGLSPA